MNLHQTSVSIEDYDLDATLSSGQAFRWKHVNGSWEGVISRHWVRLRSDGKNLLTETDRDRHRLDLAPSLFAIGCRPPRDRRDFSKGRTDASVAPILSRPASLAAGPVGMSGFIYLFVDQTNCPNPANHGRPLRTFGEPVPVPTRTCDRCLSFPDVRNGWPTQMKPICASAKWGFARHIFLARLAQRER